MHAPAASHVASIPSSYRLGDLFWANLGGSSRLMAACEAHGSLGWHYYQFGNHRHDTGALAEAASIVCRRCEPLDSIAQRVAVHLRVGDVVCGNSAAELSKRPFPPAAYAKLSLRAPAYIFAVSHASAVSSASGHHCSERSDAYIQAVQSATNGTLSPVRTADCDVCAMMDAMDFVQGQGCYSAMIAALRTSLHRPVTRLPMAHILRFCNTTAIERKTEADRDSNGNTTRLPLRPLDCSKVHALAKKVST